ncbi:MAG: hypothetical protein FI707_16840 [SAR202 cluster bacterium]|nr:hypothetical protein [Chloroflexota bacterium]MDP6420342.1 hypothetical protein [SAR202 cluster bacterium]HAL49167.1 hypothetical protein [Dehalococcoidia bacterium]MDP6663633.1 hypothetical protein [SAR202 cluster bacterium]MDP6798565.1 hypothetical protein [SAR202 cluster bacterium]
MDQLDDQTIQIVIGVVAVLVLFALLRRMLRRKPKRSESNKRRRNTSRPSDRRSQGRGGRSTRQSSDDWLDLAQRAKVKPARSPDREVSRVAKASPGASIPLAWGPVEQRIERAAERLGADPDDLDSTVDQLRYLESNSRLSDEQANLLHRMRQLRNRAAHGDLSSDELDRDAARAYGRVAKSLTGMLDKLKR